MVIIADTLEERICRIARDYRVNEKVSAAALDELADLRTNPAALTRKSILDVLRRDPALIEDWELWSENQRRDGWSFRSEHGQFEVYHHRIIGAEPVAPNIVKGGHDIIDERLTFDDRFEACAEYVLREALWMSRLAKKTN